MFLKLLWISFGVGCQILRKMLLNWAFIALVPLAQAIHKDQIGQLDWLKSHIGVPSHVSFARSQSGASLALGSVAANTVSVLSPATGSFVWRQHFAANEKLLAVERVSTNVIAAVAYLPSSDSFAIRTFDAASGFVLTDVVASAGRNKVCTPNACNGSVRVVAVPASGRTKTSDFVALLPGGKVIRVDAARGELAWQQTVTSTPSANLEVNDQQVFVVSSSDANDFSVEVLALADGALRSSTAPSIKTVSCFVQSDAAVLCNLQRGGVTAFVAGNKKAVALDAGSLFEGEDVSSKTLSVISLGHRTNEYIVSSGGRAVVVTLDANSDKAVVSRRHTFSSISPADSPIYSATTGDKRNPFIARLVVSKKANAAEVQLFDVEGSKGVESFSFPIDFGETGSIKSVCSCL
ncbi:hypothetical protein BDR26DRAFT_381387 [Obelidium mucronatum]|nr:hypothetical protein BDR26DRAFT_381387 [Obelidium mucronatum]